LTFDTTYRSSKASSNKKIFADRNEVTHRVARAANDVKQSDLDLSTMSLKQATDSVNRYCTCNENICNCCRDFHIPLVQLKGPGNYHAMQLYTKNESVVRVRKYLYHYARRRVLCVILYFTLSREFK